MNEWKQIEFLEQYYNPVDLTNFFAYMGLPNIPVANVIGFNDPAEGSISGGEAQLDIQVFHFFFFKLLFYLLIINYWFWLL